MTDKFWSFIIGAAVFAFFCAIIVGIINSSQTSDTAEQLAKADNCKYLGRAKHVSSVGFFDCDGKIELKKLY